MRLVRQTLTFEESTGYCRRCAAVVTATRARLDRDEVRSAMIIGGFINLILGLFLAAFSIARPWRCSQCSGLIRQDAGHCRHVGRNEWSWSLFDNRRLRWLVCGALGIAVGIVAWVYANSGSSEIVKATYWANRGDELRLKGEYEKAIDMYQLAIEREPSFSQPWYGWGVVLQDRGDLNGAIEKYKKTIALAPKDARPWLSWGYILEMKGDWGGARQVYQQAAQSHPGDAEFWNTWGIVLEGKGSLADAADKYRMALDIDPTNDVYRSNLAAVEGAIHKGK